MDIRAAEVCTEETVAIDDVGSTTGLLLKTSLSTSEVTSGVEEAIWEDEVTGAVEEAGKDVATGMEGLDDPSRFMQAKLMEVTLDGLRTGPSSFQSMFTYGQQIRPSAIVTISPAI